MERHGGWVGPDCLLAVPAESEPLDRQRHAAPVPACPSYGRDGATREIFQLLEHPGCRAVTLTGLPGVGKTHLAAVVAEQAARRFRRPCSWISLADITDPHALAAALDRRPGTGAHPPAEPSPPLLVLDPFAHLLPPAAADDTARRLVAERLAWPSFPQCLIVSRVPLHVPGEWVYPVPPLTVPEEPVPGSAIDPAERGSLDRGLGPVLAAPRSVLRAPRGKAPLTFTRSPEPGARSAPKGRSAGGACRVPGQDDPHAACLLAPSLRSPGWACPLDRTTRHPERLLAFPSVQLFVERARAGDPEWRLTEQNGPAVAALCRSLDGLPLAIECVAAQVRVLTVEEICHRWQGAPDRLALLVGPAGEQLRAALEGQFARLSPAAQRLLTGLAARTGEFSLAAVEAAAGTEAATALQELIEASWLRKRTVEACSHYRVLETVRAFAASRLPTARRSGSVPPASPVCSPAAAPSGTLPARSRSLGPAPVLLRVHLLGEFQVWNRRERISASAWQRPKVAALFQWLCLQGSRRIRRDEVMEVLWGNLPVERAPRNLATTLSMLRRALGPLAQSCLQSDTETLQLAGSDVLWVDVAAFEREIARAHCSRQQGDSASMSRHARQALALYRGELLPHLCLDDWVLSHRMRLAELRLHALTLLASQALAEGEAVEAESLARQALEQDPHEETALRVRMEALAQLEQCPEALRCFEKFRQVLRRELGAEPDLATLRLVDRLRASGR